LGNGITVSNKKETDPNTKDYKFIAHISNNGKIEWKDKDAQRDSSVRREVEKHAKSMNESDCGCGSKINEGNAFGAAVTAAKKAGQKEFEFNGKTYKVKKGSYEKNEAKKESVNESVSVFDERHYGKKGIIIMIDDGGKKVSAIFKDKRNADKYNRNKPEDVKKLLDLAKKTPYPKAIDESINEGKHDSDLDKVEAAVKNASSFMGVGAELKKAGIKYDFSTSMIPMYRIKVAGNTIGIANKKYVAGAEREVKDMAIGLLEGITGRSLKVENLSPDIAKHMIGIYKGFQKVESDGVMIYDSPKNAEKAAEYLNKKKIAASSDGKYLYIESKG
jgi:hypothetical protein